MFNCVGLSKKELTAMKELNNSRKYFNELNDDFFEDYISVGFAQQIFMLKRVKLLKLQSEYVGYSWISVKNRKTSIINSINVEEGLDAYKACSILLSSNKGKTDLCYLCSKNDFNFRVLAELGFKKGNGTIEMYKHIDGINNFLCDENISFQVFQKGVNEKIRCDLQNEIFKNSNREPLTAQDIYYDELQNYYYNNGSIFIKYKDKYIGYGQVIFESDYPTIVNFGILKEYRSHGFGKMLLEHLLNVIKKYHYDYAFIRVKSENERAIKLYRSCGFEINKESYNWTLNRM